MPPSSTHIPHTPSPATQLSSPTFQNPNPDKKKQANNQTNNTHPQMAFRTLTPPTALLHHHITQMMPPPTKLQKPDPQAPTPQQTKPYTTPTITQRSRERLKHKLSPSLSLSEEHESLRSSSGKFAFWKALCLPLSHVLSRLRLMTMTKVWRWKVMRMASKWKCSS